MHSPQSDVRDPPDELQDGRLPPSAPSERTPVTASEPFPSWLPVPEPRRIDPTPRSMSTPMRSANRGWFTFGAVLATAWDGPVAGNRPDGLVRRERYLGILRPAPPSR
jgi:hypothetical protein